MKKIFALLSVFSLVIVSLSVFTPLSDAKFKDCWGNWQKGYPTDGDCYSQSSVAPDDVPPAPAPPQTPSAPAPVPTPSAPAPIVPAPVVQGILADNIAQRTFFYKPSLLVKAVTANDFTERTVYTPPEIIQLVNQPAIPQDTTPVYTPPTPEYEAPIYTPPIYETPEYTPPTNEPVMDDSATVVYDSPTYEEPIYTSPVYESEPVVESYQQPLLVSDQSYNLPESYNSYQEPDYYPQSQPNYNRYHVRNFPRKYSLRRCH